MLGILRTLAALPHPNILLTYANHEYVHIYIYVGKEFSYVFDRITFSIYNAEAPLIFLPPPRALEVERLGRKMLLGLLPALLPVSLSPAPWPPMAQHTSETMGLPLGLLL